MLKGIPGSQGDLTDYTSPPAALPEDEMMSVMALEQALYGEDFVLSEDERTFVDTIMSGKPAISALVKIRPSYAKRGAKLLRATAGRWCKKPQIAAYLRWRRAQVSLRAAVTDSELIENERIVFQQATGRLRTRESVVFKDEELKETIVEDVMVYAPNLAAANQATENLRKIANIGGPGTMTHNIRDQVRSMTQEERRKKERDILSKYGVLVDAEVVGD